MKFIYDAWRDFVGSGYISDKVRSEIADSWKRCRAYGVDPMDGRGNNQLEVSMEEKLMENADLISVSRSIMEGLYNIVAGTGFAIFLTDKYGYIIERIGDCDILKKADDLNFVKGQLWAEKVVGTNAIGTALKLDKPIQTIGAEHYGAMQHSWTCSAAPIHDEDGNIVGCINMSGDCHSAHSHTLGIVTAAAESIQKQMALSISYNLLNITFDSICEGMIVLDDKFKIKRVNDKAMEILGFDNNDTLGIDIRNILKNSNVQDIVTNSEIVYTNMECDFFTKNKRIKCIINAVPMRVNGKFIGIVITFREAQHVHKLVNKVVGYKAAYRFEDIITRNKKMKNINLLSQKAAKSDCNILIEGESGTGKELIAQSIHNYSSRESGPFVAVNCASIPRELVESELFGYEKGAFTGASREGHPGKFELADGGTIFLDEVGELPLDIQSKLLRVLDNNKIIRVGGTYEKQLNVRVIGATNRTLREEVKKKNFREDLFYRLSVINIKTMPLRDRKDDIEVLVKHFIDELNVKSGKEFMRADKDYIDKLKKYDWPGNVRELRNIVERDYYISDGDEDLASVHYEEKTEIKKEYDSDIIPMQDIEKETIENALRSCGWNVVLAAKCLNLSRATLYRKIKRYKINNIENKVCHIES